MNKKQPEQFEFQQTDSLAATGTDTAAPAVAHDLRRLAAERLAAHRQRRNRLHAPQPLTPQPAAPHNPIAAAVFERYSQSPSYRAVLAEQAHRAIQQANTDAEAAVAEAEVAARNAHAVAEAQKRLLAELQLWNAPQIFSPQTAQTFRTPTKPTPEPAPPAQTEQQDPWDWSADSLADSRVDSQSTPIIAPAPAAATIPHTPAPAPEPAPAPKPAPSSLPEAFPTSELDRLEDEIAFRQAPVFEPFSLQSEPIAANLVEFPRQIVAPRKARPRLAESPAFDRTNSSPDSFPDSFPAAFPAAPQLRIFEAEPEAEPDCEPQIPSAQAASLPTPAWAGLRLDAERASFTPAPLPEDEILIRESLRSASYSEAFGEQPAIQAASFGLRVMAAAVDLMFVGFSLLLALSVTARILHHLPTGRSAGLALAVSLAILWPLYLLLFFSLSDQTPGMRFARIGFCSFNDEAPTRAAIRKRILSQLLALAPLGIGIFAALFDSDRLGWHDRTSKMYPRSY